MTTTKTNDLGLASTPEALAKLELIASFQTASPVAEDVEITGTDFPNHQVPLDFYMNCVQRFFSESCNKVEEVDEKTDEYLEFVRDGVIFLALKRGLCKTSMSKIGDVWGLTKDQVNGICQRLSRRFCGKTFDTRDFAYAECFERFQRFVLLSWESKDSEFLLNDHVVTFQSWS